MTIPSSDVVMHLCSKLMRYCSCTKSAGGRIRTLRGLCVCAGGGSVLCGVTYLCS